MCTEIEVPIEVLTSTFRTLRPDDSGRTALLQQAFYNVEAEYPGFSTYFTSGLLQRLGFFDDASTAESVLRLCVLEEPTTHQVPIPYPSLRCFLTDTLSLRSTLVRIPETIKERQAFIVIIRYIATELKCVYYLEMWLPRFESSLIRALLSFPCLKKSNGVRSKNFSGNLWFSVVSSAVI
ncbi:hypothetical protein CRM22_000825 [Opisthorchis felineus]|uniref:Uncharacterized protein n=1 Tax=Opisthorchis felineus TaxID=147828 RepID=A0A4V6RH85_OPIFE|nr:hypothetical protein CRM22_000825 [Opisthorchis felineus]